MNIINLTKNLKKAAAGNTPHPILLFEAVREIERLQSQLTQSQIDQENQKAIIIQFPPAYNGRLAS